MTESSRLWASGDAYEPYVGRWSALVGAKFLDWLDVPEGGRWLDVGCGTGALTEAILDRANPDAVLGADLSEGFVEYARRKVADPRAEFVVAGAERLPSGEDSFDAVVSGLVLNFLADPGRGMAEMERVARPGGVVGAYLWDYAGKMELMRYFWDAAAALDPAARELDEGRRFPLSKPGPLTESADRAGWDGVEVTAIDVPTTFLDFEDYWSPFLGGQGPAPSYAASLSEDDRIELRERLREMLPFGPGGRIELVARAWAIKGTTSSPATRSSGPRRGRTAPRRPPDRPRPGRAS